VIAPNKYTRQTLRIVRCAVCDGATVQCVTYAHADDGTLWRVPVHVCTNATCLRECGGVPISLVPVGGIR
jgi:hypothetical protein